MPSDWPTHIEFRRLNPYPGVYVQGVGGYGENGQSKTVAVALGPEFGTVGPELIREAAKEAVKIADLLVVCGFAFDPLAAGEEATRLGRLTVLQAHMDPDLGMGDELLKKTGAGNLFMVFGEPDIDVRLTADGMVEVEIRGLDCLRPHDRRAALIVGRRHRRLVPRHRLRRRGLLRPARLPHRRRRPPR